jgi:hypothetical protein
MLSHEFIQAAANMLAAFGNNEQQPADITVSGRLHRVEPDLDDYTDTRTMVAPLQQKLELLKKAVDVNSYFDEGEPGFDPGPNEGDKSDEELEEIKKLAGVMHNAGDDNDVLDA